MSNTFILSLFPGNTACLFSSATFCLSTVQTSHGCADPWHSTPGRLISLVLSNYSAIISENMRGCRMRAMRLSVHSVNGALRWTQINVISPSGAGNQHFCDLLARAQDHVDIILKYFFTGKCHTQLLGLCQVYRWLGQKWHFPCIHG